MNLRETLRQLESQLGVMESRGLELPTELAEQAEDFLRSSDNLLEFVNDYLAAAENLEAQRAEEEPCLDALEPMVEDIPKEITENTGQTGVPVLLVEDNMVNRKLAVLILERVGCRVDVALDGAEGVEKYKSGHYAAIFMDCQMPVMDGYEATRAIRKLEAGASHIPIIAVTANAMKGDKEKCLACGMDDYISKPLRPHDLQEAVSRWCKVRV